MIAGQEVIFEQSHQFSREVFVLVLIIIIIIIIIFILRIIIIFLWHMRNGHLHRAQFYPGNIIIIYMIIIIIII